jgi:acetyltransferase-like isoleucine patch superfamily enzyme
MSLIDTQELILESQAKIKHLVRIKGVKSVIMKSGSYLGNYNSLYCNSRIGDQGSFKLGNNSDVVRKNSFDLTDDVTIGDNVVVGGFGSQFWTHGFDIHRNRVQGEIVIGDNVYIGSSTSINLAVSVLSNVSIGCSSVVSKSIIDEGFYAGNPAVKKKSSTAIMPNEYLSEVKTVGNSKFFRKKI